MKPGDPIKRIDAPSVKALGVSDDLVDAYFWLQARSREFHSNIPASWVPALRRLESLGLVSRTGSQLYPTPPLRGKPVKILFETRSVFQEIRLEQVGQDVVLFLNGEIQNHSLDDAGSHELMVDVPLELAKNAERVLILGGGDGLAAHQALQHDSVKLVQVIELCPGVIHMAKTDTAMRRLNHDAFHDPRVELVVGDAISHLLRIEDRFDVIVDDCEYGLTDQPDGQDLDVYWEYIQTLPRRLADGGVGSVMSPLNANTRAEMESMTPALQGNSFIPELTEDWVDQLKLVLSELWPYTTHRLYRSVYLDAELFTYFSRSPF